eukprot:328497-Amorphochlora_amoeboformis.AAC.2
MAVSVVQISSYPYIICQYLNPILCSETPWRPIGTSRAMVVVARRPRECRAPLLAIMLGISLFLHKDSREGNVVQGITSFRRRKVSLEGTRRHTSDPRPLRGGKATLCNTTSRFSTILIDNENDTSENGGTSEEPILRETKQRFVLLPIHYQKVWKMYKQHQASFWTAEEIDLAADVSDWPKLTPNEQHFIKM